MKRGQWKFLAVAIASFALAAMAAGGSSPVKVARTQLDGGMDMPEHHMHDADAGVMDMDAGVPGEMQGSLRGAPRSFAKTVAE